MKNCHKRWKRIQKAKDRELQESNERSQKGLEDMLFFFQKHPDQAVYEMSLYQKGEATGSISEPLK